VSVERVNPVTNIVLSGNLLTNGDFEGGTDLRDLPNGWIFDQPDGPFRSAHRAHHEPDADTQLPAAADRGRAAAPQSQLHFVQ
jgi:hypothetical protein